MLPPRTALILIFSSETFLGRRFKDPSVSFSSSTEFPAPFPTPPHCFGLPQAEPFGSTKH